MNASAAIIHHPDVRRMLMTMRAYTEGCRAMATVAAPPTTPRTTTPMPQVRKQNQAFYEFMVPLVKGYSTEMSLEVTSLGVQVHGGMGFIEETGAAQYYRDAKILTIYEGTTAIQANDLVGRKTARDGGQSAKAIAAQIEKTEANCWPAAPPPPRPWQAPGRRRARPSWMWSTSCRWRQGQPQRRVCRQRALPDAGRQPGGGLAAGAQPAGGRGSCCPRDRTSLHARQDHHGAVLRRPHPGQGARPARQHRGRRDSVTELALEAF
jgi:hypothetical protein